MKLFGVAMAGSSAGFLAYLAGYGIADWQFYAICAPIWIGVSMAAF